MAALYLHNAIFSPPEEPSPSQHYHQRTISSATVQSYPTEPLLNHQRQDSSTAISIGDQELSHLNGSNAGWDMGPLLDRRWTNQAERKGYWEHKARRRLRWFHSAKWASESIMMIWMLYSIVRYFIAFTTYDSMPGRISSLILACVATVSITFLSFSLILRAFHGSFLTHGIKIRTLLIAQSIFLGISAFLLFVPAIVSFVLVFIWKGDSNSELDFTNRCHLDVDVIWSVFSGTAACSGHSWATWLGLSILRVILTLALVLLHLIFTFVYYSARYPSITGSRRTASSQQTLPTIVATPKTNRSLHRAQASSSTMDSTGQALRSSKSHISRDSTLEEENMNEKNQNPNPSSSAPTDSDLNTFVDSFRSLVSQITQETEAALDYARTDHPPYIDHPLVSPPEEMYPPLPSQMEAYYSEFGYPPDDHVPMLNGFVRRMPTIESLGSREMTGSITSRPPTRLTDVSRSEPPSRGNSLSFAGMGEMGELPVPEGRERAGSGSSLESFGVRQNSMKTSSTGVSSLNRSTPSYHTASTGTGGSQPHSPVFDYFPPVPTVPEENNS